MPAAFPSPGDMIGRFRVLAQLGAGGMGVVYDALEVNLDRRVALKVISPLFADDPDFRSRFSSEARALASLDSPNVVQVYAHGEEDGYLYIATQLIPDGDLGQTITRWGPAPHGKAAELIEQVASGLADAHAAGLVHRDIKPANVLVRRRGSATVQAYLGDFGIARRVDAEQTRVGAGVIGTPSYMAPELHSGAPAGVTTDIYSLGCVLWVTLTGTPPYAGTTEFEIVGGHISKPVPQLASSTPLVDSLNRILRISMAKEPGHRYRSATELRDDLREVTRMTDDPAYLQAGSTVTSALTRAPGTPPTPTPTPAPTPPPHAYGPPTPTPTPTPTPHYQPQGYYTPTPTAPPKSRRGVWIGAAAGTALVLGAVTVAVLALGGDDQGDDPTPSAGGTTTSAPEPSYADGDAADIVSDAEKEMNVLDSVRITGTLTTIGNSGTVDLTITSRGDCEGTIGIGDGSAELRRVDGVAYLKPDIEFLAVSADVDVATVEPFFGQIDGRWIEGDEEASADFETICDIDELLEGDASADETYEKGELTEVDGRRAIAIDQTGGDGPATAYIALDEPHYLLKLDSSVDQGSYTFSQFDEPFSVEAPPADQIFYDTTGG